PTPPTARTKTMKYITEHTRLTDSLERELIASAIQEQMEFRHGEAMKAFFSEPFQIMARKDDVVRGEAVERASRSERPNVLITTICRLRHNATPDQQHRTSAAADATPRKVLPSAFR